MNGFPEFAKIFWRSAARQGYTIIVLTAACATLWYYLMQAWQTERELVRQCNDLLNKRDSVHIERITTLQRTIDSLRAVNLMLMYQKAPKHLRLKEK